MGPPEPWKAGATIPILFLKRTLPFTKEALQKIKQQKMLFVTKRIKNPSMVFCMDSRIKCGNDIRFC
ncbi:MAG TPA: hypothetical protein DCZ76_08395 [Treponema sp.]|nr:hypothetical protein [Treponema sp.]